MQKSRRIVNPTKKEYVTYSVREDTQLYTQVRNLLFFSYHIYFQGRDWLLIFWGDGAKCIRHAEVKGMQKIETNRMSKKTKKKTKLNNK